MPEPEMFSERKSSSMMTTGKRNFMGRISKWKKAGLQKLFFFVHQNSEQESPALAAHFIERLNKKIGAALPIPKTLKPKELFD